MKKITLALLAVLLLPVLSWATDITTLVAYQKGKYLFGGGMVWTTDTIRCDLISSTYSPSAANDQYYSTPATNTSTAAPVALGTMSTTTDSGEGCLKAGNITITATGTWRYFVIYKFVTDAAHSPLLWYGDAGGDKAAGTYILSFASGILVRID